MGKFEQERILVRNVRLPGTATSDPLQDILIDEGRFAEIGVGLEAGDARIMDYHGAIAIPGLVDGHRHVWQTSLRGALSNSVLADYYRTVRVGFATGYTPDDVYIATYAGALDALLDGVTTILDHCHIINSPEHADAAAAGLRDAGVRAAWCYSFYSPPVASPVFLKPNDRYEDLGRLRKIQFSSDDRLVTLGAALTENWLVSTEQMAEEIEAARALSLQTITCHVGANPSPTEIDRFKAAKCFGHEFVYSHCNNCSPDFFAFCSETGSSVIATPETEMGMGMGMPATNKAVDAGVSFGLGVDILSYGNGDILSNARLALSAARALHCQPDIDLNRMPKSSRYTCDDALGWATIGGAKAMGLGEKTGSIEKGKAADLVIFAPPKLSNSPAADLATTVIMHSTSRDINTVFVDGVMRVHDGQLVGVDEPHIRGQLIESAAALIERSKSSRDENASVVGTYEALIGKLQS